MKPNLEGLINSSNKGKVFCSESDLDIGTFSQICSQNTLAEDYPGASEIVSRIPIYEGKNLQKDFCIDDSCIDLKSELHRCLNQGPGVFIIRSFYQEKRAVEESTRIFEEIIEEEKNRNFQSGDHFAEAGTNARIWNSFQKVARKDPGIFIDYYKNPLYSLVSEAWLGPGYQITAQVNVVKPGGKAQSPHRDYHLGFQDKHRVSAYPKSVQIASQLLTLQGAIVHSDMPVASGPTLLLPYSHQYEPGYLAYRDMQFMEYFEQHAVQLPLKTGDAMFFSPALFHGAGSNTTEKDRIANLIQISSAFGKPMESVDRYELLKLIYPELTRRVYDEKIEDDELLAIIAAVADAYPFPTNLDLMPPVGGSAPESGQELLMRGLAENMSPRDFEQILDEHQRNRRA